MCDERERLIDCLYDECSPADRREMNAHLESCDICRTEIRALRNVREDLLAWVVPEQGNVWTPFETAPVAPWYRQVPTWALAAAASLMFVVGAAGGLVANAMASNTSAASQVATVQPGPVVDRSLDTRVAALVRSEMASHVRPAVLMPPSPATLNLVAERALLKGAETFVSESEARQLRKIQAIFEQKTIEDYRERRSHEETIGMLKEQVEQLKSLVAQLIAQQTKIQ